jgi:oxygen-independent coproporphyrinogen-3 oxidase
MSPESPTNLPVLPGGDGEKTGAGSYFVANYPPFSFWSADQVDRLEAVLERTPDPATPLGLYVHIPFCRKRCDFCYFKVYTGKNAREIAGYLDAVIAELERYARRPYLAGRPLRFVYFGGGTPSYLSIEQLEQLFGGLQALFPWDAAGEVTFECEPGTLQPKKIHALRRMGVTRLSLGVENFDPHILEINNRAHRAREIDMAYGEARGAGFRQVNIDLIAGMVGEDDRNWEACIDRTIELSPDCVTIYQMEVPYNTTIYRRMQEERAEVAPVADWPTKRRWVSRAFDRLVEAGYSISSAYTAVRDPAVGFLYRDALWTGADMLGLGVSSFSHLGGVHFQNQHHFDPYVEAVACGTLPIRRALELTEEENLVRQFILQMKLGRVDAEWFRRRHDVDVLERFREPLARHQAQGYLTFDQGRIALSRSGLLQVDRLLHDYFLPRHMHARYT